MITSLAVGATGRTFLCHETLPKVLKAPKVYSRHPKLASFYGETKEGNTYATQCSHILREDHMYEQLHLSPSLVRYFGREYDSISLEYAKEGTLRRLFNQPKERAKHGSEEVKLRYCNVALDLLTQVCSAILDLQDIGLLCHADIKPGNIFLNDSYTVKIGDLSTSFLQDSSKDAFLREAVGTNYFPRYASQELLHNKKPTTKVDVNAIGMMLVDAFGEHKTLSTAKEQPYHKRKDIREIIIMPSATSFSIIDPKQKLDEIIFHATRTDPRQRWDLATLRDALIELRE